MIGFLSRHGRPLVAMADDQTWQAVDSADPLARRIAEHLAATRPATDREVGDTHLPPGVACLSRAAAATGLFLQLAAPLPDAEDEADGLLR